MHEKHGQLELYGVFGDELKAPSGVESRRPNSRR